MKRRDFLVGTAASAAAIVGLSQTSSAQAPAAPAPARAGGAGPGRVGAPANVAASKLARVSLMTLNFSSILKLPWTANPTADQTLELLDLPKMYADVYGVHNVEFQHSHLAPNNAALGNIDGDPALLKEMKARLDAVQSTCTQINLEFGAQNVSNPDPALRQQAIDRVKKWIDTAVGLGCPRVMINQGMLTDESKANAIEAWKQMAAYGKTKGVKVSAETRGSGARAGEPPPVRPAWMLLEETIEGAGANSNVDIGNVGAPNQQALHDAIKGLYPTSSGNMHIKSSPNWDIGTAIRFTESLGYKGLYSIEVNGHPALRIVYNAILANVS